MMIMMKQLGYLLLSMHRTGEALDKFTEALNIFSQIEPESEAVAENHYCIAESLMDKGDNDGAVYHSEEAKKIREQNFGVMHSKTIDSYQQYAKLLSMNYSDYDGVITPPIRKDILTAIACYDRVFKFMKAHKDYTMKTKSGLRGKESILLTLTRTLIGLKLQLIPSQHKELLRSLRDNPTRYPEELIKEAILRLVHLTPTVYLEEIFQRISDRENTAVEELGTILQIGESSSLSFA